jgi:hypothetical protein
MPLKKQPSLDCFHFAFIARRDAQPNLTKVPSRSLMAGAAHKLFQNDAGHCPQYPSPFR